MARVKKNLLLQGISGSVGGTIVLRNVGDRTILASAPGKREKPPTPNQLRQQEKFRSGTDYAKGVMANPSDKAEYQARVKKPFESPFNLALTDAMRPPQVTLLDLGGYKGKKGEFLRVQATDDFAVKTVKVQLFAAEGSLLEEGLATAQPNGIDWLYKATTDMPDLTGMKVVAIATDRPGNTGMMEKAF